MSVIVAWASPTPRTRSATPTSTTGTTRRAKAGSRFRGAAKPDDFDFAYFAYTIGMCFQVSDVSISSPQIRRAVLGHAVLSFVRNTVILALALNLFFGFVDAP